ncbi:MAG: hypothetical protein AB8B84_02585 [Granulosicoccus sp.]
MASLQMCELELIVPASPSTSMASKIYLQHARAFYAVVSGTISANTDEIH